MPIKKNISKIKIKHKTKSPKKLLVQAPSDKTFWVNNGPVLRNLFDLGKFLTVITAVQFSYHTGIRGNDFATWVDGVLGDKVCAKALLKAKTPAAAITIIKRRLISYNA